MPIPETLPIVPVNPYGETKAMVEKILDWMDEHRELRSVRLRYFNACGAEPGLGIGEEHDPETHLIPLIFRAVHSGKPVTIFGKDYPTPDGTCVRDYVHVSDLAQAHLAALKWLDEGGTTQAFNCGTGRGNSVLEVIQAVAGHHRQCPPCHTGCRFHEAPENSGMEATLHGHQGNNPDCLGI